MRLVRLAAARILALASLGLGLAAAHAQSSVPAPWSLGIDAGAARMNVRCKASDLPCDRSGSAVGLSAGYAFDPQWGVRLSWSRAGRFTGSDRTDAGIDYGGRLDFDVYGAAATWRMPLGSVAWLELRAGLAAVDGDFRGRLGGAPDGSKTTVQPLAGIAVELPIDPRIALRLDAQLTRGKVDHVSGNLGSLGVGLVARF